MGGAEEVIDRAREVALGTRDVLNRDGATPGDVPNAAADLGDIETEIEMLLKDG